METTMNYRSNAHALNTTTALTTLSYRMKRFLKALFETRKQNPMGLDNAMSARMYL